MQSTHECTSQIRNDCFLTFRQFLLPNKSSIQAGPLSKTLLKKYGTFLGEVVLSHCMKTANSNENTQSTNESRKNSTVNVKQIYVAEINFYFQEV